MNESELADCPDDGKYWIPAAEYRRPKRRLQFGVATFLATIAAVSFLIGAISHLPTMLSWGFGGMCSEKEYAQREFRCSGFRMRVTAYRSNENGYFGLSSYHRFEVRVNGGWFWETVAEVSVEDDEPIPDHVIHKVADHCFYLFHDTMFAVTNDGGVTWSFFGGYDGSPVYPELGPNAMVQSVKIDRNGHGRMVLTEVERPAAAVVTTVVATEDYGLSWQKQETSVP